MTIKEALIATIGVSVPESIIDKAILDTELTGSDTYSKTDEKSVDTAAISVLHSLLSTPDITEGGFSIRLDRAAIEKRINYLCSKHSISNPLKPTVTGRSVW